MRILILMGSPLKNGNTATLLWPFLTEIQTLGAEVDYVSLHEKKIAGCTDCRACQHVPDRPGCPIQDDMQPLYKAILAADGIVLATPIFTWFCTAPMKAVLDRLFSMNKYYQSSTDYTALLKGKKLALITTCGDEIECGADLFEEALKRLAHHSRMDYIGMLAVRDVDGIQDFLNENAVKAAIKFAHKAFEACREK